LDKSRVDPLIHVGSQIVERARKKGADIAEVVARDSRELSAKVRLGEPELIEEAGSHALGLRVICGGRSAVTYTSDPSPAGVEALVEDAIELARLSQPDEFAVPPEPSLLVTRPPDLDLYDPELERLDAKEATRRAIRAENAARGFDKRITNSEGATFQRVVSASALVTSGGFRGGYHGSYVAIDVNPVADDADGKKRQGSHWDARRYLGALEPAEEVGVRAAQKTIAKLGAKKIGTCEVPVVFDPDAGRGLLSLLFSCLAGTAIYQRASYLLDKENQPIASPLVTVVDDALLLRGLASRPFDGEGLPSRKNVVVEGGVLKTYLLDTYSGKKLGRPSTGSASRGVGSRPSVAPTNFYLLPGDRAPDEIVKSVERGLYVTSMMGFGFNAVTGDFSRGAEGFWIERGEKKFPVGEITIGLNFLDFWKGVDAIANNLDIKSSFATPTFRVRRMTVAGL
jgi:PmbA protein